MIMFGYVSAAWQELTKAQQDRYGSVYCGICREIRLRAGQVARLGLSYDMTFLALLLLSLYEPEEEAGKNHCMIHPIKRRPWVDNEIIRYCADMNVALAYYNCLDDWQDEGKTGAKLLAKNLEQYLPAIESRWPRQCAAIRQCLQTLSRLEKENCSNPDLPAAAFGALMEELMLWQEDHWQTALRQLGQALGRFIYLMDAAMDYDKDSRRGKYNPWLAQGKGKDPARWEEALVLTLARAAAAFEKLPLVQDKGLLDNILYSGVWVNYRGNKKVGDQP